MVYRRNLKRSNRKSRSNRSLKRNTHRQRGGDRGVHMPIQYFNPGAKVPTYYPEGHAMLTKPHVSSSYGTFSAVNTTNVNQGGISMGPNLFPAPTSSGMMVGGRSRSRSTTGRTKAGSRSRSTTGRTKAGSRSRSTTGRTKAGSRSRSTTGRTKAGTRTTTGTAHGTRTTTGTTGTHTTRK
jgi:hypothetical protein